MRSKQRAPTVHTREYHMNEHYQVDLVPAPTAQQRRIPTLDTRMLPTGVLHTFVDMPKKMPVVSQLNCSKEEIQKHFPAPGK